MQSIKLLRTGYRTIVLITRDRLVRADFAAGRVPVLKGFWQRSRPESDDPALLVETALRLGRKRPKRVVVLNNDLWLQTLHMPSDAVRGLNSQETSRALCFEAEPLSGIPAFDSQVGYVAVRSAEGSAAGQRDFCIAQATGAELAQTEDAVRQAGGLLEGLTHPAALIRPLVAAGEAWQRIDLWPGAIVCLRQTAGNTPQMHVINTDPAQRGWQATVDAWLGTGAPAGNTEWLVPEAGIQAPEAEHSLSLLDEASLRMWLAAWAEQLAGAPAGVPLVRPAARPMSKEKRLAITATLAASAGLAVFGHYSWAERNMTALAARTKVLNDQIARFEAMKKQGTELAGKVVKAKGELATISGKLTDCSDTLEAHRLRWQKLLKLLSDLRPEDLVVQKIDGHGERLSISGLCLGPHPANELATDLGTQVGPLGWLVEPARQESGKRLMSGQPWRFDLVLTESPAKDLAASPAPPPVRPIGPREPVNKVVSFEKEETVEVPD